MNNDFGFKIVLPERKINVSTLKKMWKYFTNDSVFAGNIIYSEESSKSLDSISVIAQFGPVVLPVKITERAQYLHFDTVVTNLSRNPSYCFANTHVDQACNDWIGIPISYPTGRWIHYLYSFWWYSTDKTSEVIY